MDQFRKDPVYDNPAATCEQQAMIDDGEDRDDQILMREKRGGYWSTFADKVGSTIDPSETKFTMADAGAHGSRHAIHIKGKLGTTGETYAGVGVDFRNPPKVYDGSRYKGVAFLAKVGPGSTTHIRFTVPDVNTAKEAGVCTECFNDFGIPVELTEEWTRYEVPFSELRQEPGWGNPRPPAVDVHKLWGLAWQVSAAGTAYDIWIDDVTFTGCP
jgi:endoglucanase